MINEVVNPVAFVFIDDMWQNNSVGLIDSRQKHSKTISFKSSCLNMCVSCSEFVALGSNYKSSQYKERLTRKKSTLT